MREAGVVLGMSIKIYEAYRIRAGRDRKEVLRDIRLRGEEVVKKKLVEILRIMWQCCRPEIDRSRRYFESQRLLSKWITEDTSSKFMEAFDASVELTVYEHNRRTYILPAQRRISVFREAYEFLEDHPDLEDYCYFNSSDRPDEVTTQSWNARKRVWNQIMNYGGNGDGMYDRLTLQISHPLHMYRLYPFGSKEAIPSEPVLKTVFQRLSPTKTKFGSNLLEGPRLRVKLYRSKWIVHVDGKRVGSYPDPTQAYQLARWVLKPKGEQEEMESFIKGVGSLFSGKKKAPKPDYDTKIYLWDPKALVMCLCW